MPASNTYEILTDTGDVEIVDAENRYQAVKNCRFDPDMVAGVRLIARSRVMPLPDDAFVDDSQ